MCVCFCTDKVRVKVGGVVCANSSRDRERERGSEDHGVYVGVYSVCGYDSCKLSLDSRRMDPAADDVETIFRIFRTTPPSGAREKWWCG